MGLTFLVLIILVAAMKLVDMYLASESIRVANAKSYILTHFSDGRCFCYQDVLQAGYESQTAHTALTELVLDKKIIALIQDECLEQKFESVVADLPISEADLLRDRNEVSIT